MKKLILLLAFAVRAAAGDGAVSLSPAVIMLRGEGGQSTTQTLLLRNGTSRTLAFDTVAQDVVVRGGKRIFVAAGQTPASIAATAVFSQKRVTVRPGESAAVSVTLTIPPNTTERSVVVLFRGSDRIMQGTTAMTASLGSLLTFTLTNDVKLAADPMVVQPQTATSNLIVTQMCTNSGSEPLTVRGVLALIGGDGKLAGKSAMEPRRLLPGERVQLGTQYGAELAPGRYRVLVTYAYEGRALTELAEVVIR